jgi:hypothetical protein
MITPTLLQELREVARRVIDNGNGHSGESTPEVIARQRDATAYERAFEPHEVMALLDALSDAWGALEKIARGPSGKGFAGMGPPLSPQEIARQSLPQYGGE